MPAGLRALRRIQFGKESTAGTAVAATEFVVGKLGQKLEQELYMPDDLETGRLASFERSEVIARESVLPFESDANYEQIAMFLDMAVRGGVSATGADPHLWVFEPVYNASNAPGSYTVEYGDNVHQFETSYVSCRQLEFSGQVGDVVKINADLFGRDTISSSFTSNINVPSVLEAVKMAHGKLYVNDTWTALVGNSPAEVGGTLVDFSYKIMTGITPQKFADGRLDFSELAEAKRHVELELTAAFNTTTSGYFDTLYKNQNSSGANVGAQGMRMFGLHFDNGATTTSNRKLKLQLSGKLTEYDTLTEREGQNIVKLKVVSEYDDTPGAARDMRVELVNGRDVLINAA